VHQRQVDPAGDQERRQVGQQGVGAPDEIADELHAQQRRWIFHDRCTLQIFDRLRPQAVGQHAQLLRDGGIRLRGRQLDAQQAQAFAAQTQGLLSLAVHDRRLQAGVVQGRLLQSGIGAGERLREQPAAIGPGR
jgi:hypothetical protein